MMPDELDKHVQDWAAALRDAGKSPNTVRSYVTSVRVLTAWQRAHGSSGLDREGVRGFIGSILDGAGSRDTARTRAKALLRFSRWLADEGIAVRDELAGMSVPEPGQVLVPRLSDDEVGALVSACAADASFAGCWDEAFVRISVGVPVRIEEMLFMDLPGDLDIMRQRASLLTTKGNGQRRIPFSGATRDALDQYMSVRGRLAGADDGPLWLSQRGRRLSYSGLYASLCGRAGTAGIRGYYPYRMRHTAAVRWLLAGGSEGNLMAIGGWKRREMIDRYVAEARMEMALAEGDRILSRA